MPFTGPGACCLSAPPSHNWFVERLARLVDIYARRLQVQERMTTQIATTLMKEINPLGVAVVLEAEHLCMRMRGVEKQNSWVTTSAMLGVFRTNVETRQEFMTLTSKMADRSEHPRMQTRNRQPAAADAAALESLGEYAMRYVKPGHTIGLGTRHAAAFIRALIASGIKVRGVPTSRESEQMAREGGIEVVGLDAVDQLT